MKKIILVISLVISLVLCSAEKTDFIREVLAKNDGFASEGKGTTGGAGAVQKNIFKVTNKKEFIEAIRNRKNSDPKILMIYGTIDFDTDNNGKTLKMEDYMVKGYDFQKYLETHASKSSASKSLKEDQEGKRGQSQKNQSKNITVHVPANTSIIGIENAKLKGVDLVLDSDNVIIRNIMLL